MDSATTHQLVIVLDFGGQYNQLIARRVRECHVFCEVLPSTTPIQNVINKKPIGIIFTGGPNSVYEESSPKIDPKIFDLGIPILGICYGAQLMAHLLGGHVVSPDSREYGKTDTQFINSPIFQDFHTKNGITWMSHTDYIDKLPTDFVSIALTAACPAAAIMNEGKKLFGLQFHPEVQHTENGTKMISNFLYNVCHARGDWTMRSYIDSAVVSIKQQVGDGKVILGLSGGVDSSVTAFLLSKAIGKQLTCLFVDHGLMRKDERAEVEAAFASQPLQFVSVDASSLFFGKLKGVNDPEAKRHIIGEEFVRVFEEEAKKVGTVDFLAQGTIYPDVIESGAGSAAKIKSHHNVGGLPEKLGFRGVVEPLRSLFKDEVRELGRELGLPKELVERQPFPGPGLAIRIIGDITPEKVKILQEADAIFREEIGKAHLSDQINQYFAVLTNMRSVGVMGDTRTYDYTVALRGVTTTDFMTADWARIPYETLDVVSRRIINEVRGVNRIVYDITSKPPSTIEWE